MAVKRRKLTTFQLIMLGFVTLILLGSLLLMLPFATTKKGSASFQDTLFTATSAACVTGLVVRDTGTYWTPFGQAVILVLIQVGGLGVVTVTTLLALMSGRRIGLLERSTLQDSVSAQSMGGILKLAVFMLKVTLSIEGAGALLLLPVFIREFGFGQGLWYAVFHSVSAFCNAGFDLMGVRGAFSSLTGFAGDGWLNAVVMLLIVLGGIGFLTIDDVLTHRHHLQRYRMQSKVILLTSAVLILVPALLLFFLEYSGEPLGRRILESLFQSVTTRTAGFNTADLSAMSHSGLVMMIVLMLIGGSPGSTAGGMKTTTIAVLIASMLATFGRRKDTAMFRRRVDPSTIRTASALLMMYLILCVVCAAVIGKVDHLPIMTALFETASAVGTVGITLGVTPTLSLVSRSILIALMFIGRVGGLTLIYAHVSAPNTVSTLPLEKITVG